MKRAFHATFYFPSILKTFTVQTHVSLVSCVWLFEAPCTVACQAPLWNSPGKNTGVGCHSHLQGIFPTQGSNPHLLHYRQILYHLSHQGSQSFNRSTEILGEISILVILKSSRTLWTYWLSRLGNSESPFSSILKGFPHYMVILAAKELWNPRSWPLSILSLEDALSLASDTKCYKIMCNLDYKPPWCQEDCYIDELKMASV